MGLFKNNKQTIISNDTGTTLNQETINCQFDIFNQETLLQNTQNIAFLSFL